MDHFSGIVPCGITDGTVTSMQTELGTVIDLNVVKERLAVEFRRVFRNTPATHEQS
jgi:lipoate-protein ligase B